MREYEDIKYKEQWLYISEVDKGWSEDKKFYVKTKGENELLLRICDIRNYEKKKKGITLIELMATLSIFTVVMVLISGILLQGYKIFNRTNNYYQR